MRTGTACRTPTPSRPCPASPSPSGGRATWACRSADPDLHDPPYTPVMDDARNTVKAACDKAGLAFLCSWADESMTEEERVRYAIGEIGARIVHAAQS